MATETDNLPIKGNLLSSFKVRLSVNEEGVVKHQYENVASLCMCSGSTNSIYQPNPQFSAFPRQVCCCKLIRMHIQR